MSNYTIRLEEKKDYFVMEQDGKLIGQIFD